jgi:hypothetical protein
MVHRLVGQRRDLRGIDRLALGLGHQQVSGRGRLPMWVFRMRTVLRFMLSTPCLLPNRQAEVAPVIRRRRAKTPEEAAVID